MRVLNTLFILFTLLLLLSFSALAQDEETTEEAPVILGDVAEDGTLIAPLGSDVADTLDVQFAAFIAVLVTAIWNLVYIPVASPLVEIATSLAKRLPLLDTVSSPALTLTFTVLAWIGYVVLTQLGYGDRFDNLITGLVTIATTIFGIPVTQVAAKKIHNFAQAHNVPIFGYSRTPSLPTAVRNELVTIFEQEIMAALSRNVGASNSEPAKVPLKEAVTA
jgi:hypothetical protein